ncbi:MAG: hypothetical protein HUU57_16450 [Bdellovibrio sp.]|nr:hypothetical protein [Bdellovibrio sp.]
MTATQDALEKAFFESVVDILENRLFLKESDANAWMETLAIYETTDGIVIQLVDDQFSGLLLESSSEELIDKVHQLLLQTPLKAPESSIKIYKVSSSSTANEEGKFDVTYIVNEVFGGKERYPKMYELAAKGFLEAATNAIEKKLLLKRSKKVHPSSQTIALYESSNGASIEVLCDDKGIIKVESTDQQVLAQILELLSEPNWRVWV